MVCSQTSNLLLLYACIRIGKQHAMVGECGLTVCVCTHEVRIVLFLDRIPSLLVRRVTMMDLIFDCIDGGEARTNETNHSRNPTNQQSRRKHQMLLQVSLLWTVGSFLQAGRIINAGFSPSRSSGKVSCLQSKSKCSRRITKQSSRSPPSCFRNGRRGSTRLDLVPLDRYPQMVDFLSDLGRSSKLISPNGIVAGISETEEEPSLVLGVVEESDLPDVARFTVQVFGADAIRLSSDLNALERAIMKPTAELLNGYSALVAFAEVLQGLRSRLWNARLLAEATPQQARAQYLDRPMASPGRHLAGQSSLVLAVARNRTNCDDASATDAFFPTETVASVELRLQPCDAKIPFTLPWLDSMERKVSTVLGLNDASPEEATNLQPYLSNLCVDERFRGRGLGRALVRAVECVALQWGYDQIFLHVDCDNAAAYQLYRLEGYRDVGRRWNPFWAGRSSQIGYFVKNLKGGSSTPKASPTADVSNSMPAR